MKNIKKFVNRKMYAMTMEALKRGYCSPILLVEKLFMVFTIVFLALAGVAVVGVFVAPGILKVVRVILLLDLFCMLLIMVNYEALENFRKSFEKDFKNLFQRFVFEEFEGWINFIKIDEDKVLRNIVENDKNFKRFLRILTKINFSPSRKVDFMKFNFKNKKFLDNSIYNVLCDDILCFFRNFGAKKGIFTEDELEFETEGFDEIKEALKYFNLKESFTEKELKQAYKDKLKEVHPDCGGSSEEFIKAKDMFDLLS